MIGQGPPPELSKIPEQVTCGTFCSAHSIRVPLSMLQDGPVNALPLSEWKWVSLPRDLRLPFLVRPTFWDECFRLRIRCDAWSEMVLDVNAFVFCPGAVEVEMLPGRYDGEKIEVAFGLDEEYVAQSGGIPSFTLFLRSVTVALWKR